MRNFMVLVVIFLIGATSISAQDSPPTLSIPSIQVAAHIVSAPYSAELKTWDVSHLHMNVGHMEFTSWFGAGHGNIVLGAHSETSSNDPDIFYNLSAVQVGDEITINANGTSYVYRVVEIRSVSAYDTSILHPTVVETLTLMTCDISSYTEGDYSRRTVVIAERTTG